MNKNLNISSLPRTTIFLDAAGTLLRESANSSKIEIYPDATSILEAFAARRLNNSMLTTGIITNWGVRIHQILESLGLKNYFDVVVCLDDVKEGKPHPLIFQTACTRANASLSSTYHLGDSWDSDVLGAISAGLQAIWINRQNAVHPRLGTGTFRPPLKHKPCRNLAEAADYLATIIS